MLESEKALNEEEADNAQHLMGLILGSSEDGQSVIEDLATSEEAEEAEFLDALEDSPAQYAIDDPINANADEFIRYFSSINVTKHTII
jgi:FlaA1/EpsC-like NDP-sugar epimerase